MSTLSPNKLMTAEELLALGPDFHGELVKGRLIEMAPASWEHGDVALTIGSLLHVFVRERKLGKTFAAETGFILARDPDSVRAPDVAFVTQTRLANGASKPGFFDGAPDLAVEVLSPSNTSSEMAAKITEYFEAGCRLVWVIDTARRTVTVHRLTSQAVALQISDTLDGGDVLPGFSVSVSDLFC